MQEGRHAAAALNGPLGDGLQIHVTKCFLPPIGDYERLLGQVWQSGQLTNNGELVRRLESSLAPWHGTKEVLFVGNGTIALQLAIKALDLTGEIITTPFSYAASTTAILWEGCTPVFADIDPRTFCIDPDKVVTKIGPRTSAILATHVYGVPCDVDRLERIAEEHGLKLIFDAAHAFGTQFQGSSLLCRGDVSTCSFHATKLFHTVEGGSVVTKDSLVMRRLRLMRAFGHMNDDHILPGINGKNSEFHAAMGLAVLPYMEGILERRAHQWTRYRGHFQDTGRSLISIPSDTRYNHAYFPVLFNDERQLGLVLEGLMAQGIYPRRYFYPSLSKLPYLRSADACPVAEDLARRVLCLPMFHDLSDELIDRISEQINQMCGAEGMPGVP